MSFFSRTHFLPLQVDVSGVCRESGSRSRRPPLTSPIPTRRRSPSSGRTGKRKIVRCGGTSAKERRRVSSRKIGFGLTQRLFRAHWRWSGVIPWSPQRGGGWLYRPQINYPLFGIGNQSLFQKSRRCRSSGERITRLATNLRDSETDAYRIHQSRCPNPCHFFIRLHFLPLPSMQSIRKNLFALPN